MSEQLWRHLTAAAKQQLAGVIRGVRERLLRAIHDEADRRYRLSVPIGEAGLDEAHWRRRRWSTDLCCCAIWRRLGCRSRWS